MRRVSRHAPRRMVLAALLPLILAACGGDGGMSPSADPPAYDGRWDGTIVVSSCALSGSTVPANTCDNVRGGSAPYAMTLTQRATEVTGTFSVGGDPAVSTAGTVDASGGLTLTGTAVNDSGTTMVTWYLLVRNNTLAGTFQMRGMSTDPAHGQMILGGPVATAIRQR